MAFYSGKIKSGRSCYPLLIGRAADSVHPVRWAELSTSIRRPLAIGSQWMAVNEEICSSRSYTAVVDKSVDRWNDLRIGPEDVPAISKLEDKYLVLVPSCQSEVYREELQRLKKGKHLHSISSLLALVPISAADGVLRLERASRTRETTERSASPYSPPRKSSVLSTSISNTSTRTSCLLTSAYILSDLSRSLGPLSTYLDNLKLVLPGIERPNAGAFIYVHDHVSCLPSLDTK